jgi:hypothetical protein
MQIRTPNVSPYQTVASAALVIADDCCAVNAGLLKGEIIS